MGESHSLVQTEHLHESGGGTGGADGGLSITYTKSRITDENCQFFAQNLLERSHKEKLSPM